MNAVSYQDMSRGTEAGHRQDNMMPDPLTPPESDGKGLPFIKFDGQEFYSSSFYRKGLYHPRAMAAGLKLRWEAWQRRPMASLPDDDEELAIIADFGMDVESWRNVRDIALMEFVKCADGLLYHPGIAEQANEIWDTRKKEKERKAAYRARKKAEEKKQGTLFGPAGQDADVQCKSKSQSKIKKEKIIKKKICSDGGSDGPDITDRQVVPDKGCRLPKDWALTHANREYALSRGVKDVDVMHEKFCDYYWYSAPDEKAFRQSREDWDRTWQSWCHNSKQEKSPSVAAYKQHFHEQDELPFADKGVEEIYQKSQQEWRAFSAKRQWQDAVSSWAEHAEKVGLPPVFPNRLNYRRHFRIAA